MPPKSKAKAAKAARSPGKATRTVYRDPRGRFTSKAKYHQGKKRGNAPAWKREKYKVKPGKKAPPKPPMPPVPPEQWPEAGGFDSPESPELGGKD